MQWRISELEQNRLIEKKTLNFEIEEKSGDLERISKEVENCKRQLDHANEIVNRYEEDMKELWKQREELVRENTEYEVKNQMLDEELRLVRRYVISLVRKRIML